MNSTLSAIRPDAPPAAAERYVELLRAGAFRTHRGSRDELSEHSRRMGLSVGEVSIDLAGMRSLIALEQEMPADTAAADTAKALADVEAELQRLTLRAERCPDVEREAIEELRRPLLVAVREKTRELARIRHLGERCRERREVLSHRYPRLLIAVDVVDSPQKLPAAAVANPRENKPSQRSGSGPPR